MHSEMFAQTLLWSFTMNFCICKYDSPRGSRINERPCESVISIRPGRREAVYYERNPALLFALRIADS